MLTGPEQTAFLDSVERVRSACVALLRQAKSPAAAISFVANLHRSVDAVATRREQNGPPAACRAGCSYCCSVRVEATPPEVLRIAGAAAALPVERRMPLMQRLDECAAVRRVDAHARQPCAFLEDDLCSIYELRPAACRKAHSLSVRHCETFSEQIPQDLARIVESEALMAGTAQAYRDAGLPCVPGELNAAVLAALVEPSGEELWFQSRN